MEVNYKLKQAIIDVVENQLRGNNPKATKETFDRLVSAGYDEATAKEMIGGIVIENIYFMLKEKREFNEKEFTAKLLKLKVK